MPYDTLLESIKRQATGLIAGGVDGLLIETCQDPLQIKAAVNAVKMARANAVKIAHAGITHHIPIFVQVTIETTGTMLVGTDIMAASTLTARCGWMAWG